MKIYLITDTHFGHENIIKYCNRPKNFEKIIFDNLTKIEKNSILIHLGDFAFKKVEYWANKFSKVKSFKKWLIKGNHDKKSNSWYLNHGFDFVADCFFGYLFW